MPGIAIHPVLIPLQTATTFTRSSYKIDLNHQYKLTFMKKLSILFSTAILLFFSSCEKVTGEGDLRTETRTTGNFTGIEAKVSGNLYYVQGNENKIELTAQQNILNVIETPIINNKLVVRFKNDVRVR